MMLVRGDLLHFLDDPGEFDQNGAAWEYIEDGGLYLVDGRVAACGPWAQVAAAVPAQTPRREHRGRLLLPGLVDTHVHYPQAGVIGAYGRQLLEWLTDYTFPAEAEFADPEVAQGAAAHVLERLLAHGTTTAAVYATVHAHSVDALFAQAQQRGLRLLCGKVMMDRNCPQALRDDVVSAERDCRALIERWHGRDRLRYSLTPRFAPTSTPAQLALAGALYAAWPDLHLQSHLAENPAELAWVAELFPQRRDYFDVYAHYGLAGPRSIYGHCIHLSGREREAMAASGSAAAFCPSSNTFLGSGFCDIAALLQAGVRVGLASDVGGGTSLSLIRNLGEAYKVSQFTGRPLAPMRGWYLATLGGARALYLEQFIGNFLPGKEADFIVLDLAATPDLAWRQARTRNLAERLFALQTLGDERCVRATYIQGRPVSGPEA